MLEKIVKKILDDDNECEIFEQNKNIFIFYKHKIFKFKSKKIKIFENTDMEWSFSILNLAKKDYFPKMTGVCYSTVAGSNNYYYNGFITSDSTISTPPNQNKIYVYEYDIEKEYVKNMLIEHINSSEYTFKY